jgi:hypothetical protein
MTHNRDMHLPWQFVTLGVWACGALIAVPVLVSLYRGERAMDAATDRWLLPACVVFMAAGLGAMPWLIRTGRRRVGAVNAPDAVASRRIVRLTRWHRLALGVIAFAFGAFFTLTSYQQAPTGGTFHVYVGLMFVGVVTIMMAILPQER